MYLRDASELDGLSDIFKKVKKAAHKVVLATVPRELSPLRLINKNVADKKKKSAAKLTALGTESVARTAAGDALLKMQMDTLNAVAPHDGLPVEIAEDFSAPVTTLIPQGRDFTPWVVGGALAFVAFKLLRRRNR